MGVKFNQTHAFDAISKSWVVPIRWSSWLSAWATKSTASTGLHRSTSFSRKTTEPWKLREWLPGAEVRITLLLGWLDNVGFKTNHIWKLGMRRAYLHSNTKHILELSYMQKSFSGPACRNQTFSNRFARSLMTLPRCTRAIKILWRSHGEWRYTHMDMDM